MTARLRSLLTSLCEITGAAAVALGVGWIYRPAGVIVAGLELVGIGYLTAAPTLSELLAQTRRGESSR